MKKILFIFILLFTLSGCSNTNTQEPATETLKFGIVANNSTVPFIYTYNQGIYKDNGINVELITFQNYDELKFAFDTGMIDGMQIPSKSGYEQFNSVTSTRLKYSMISNEYTTKEFNENFVKLDGKNLGVINDSNINDIIDVIEKEYNIEFNVKIYEDTEKLNKAFESGEVDLILVGDYFPVSNLKYIERVLWDSTKDEEYNNYIIWQNNVNQTSIDRFYAITNEVISKKSIEDFREVVLEIKLYQPDEYYNYMPSNYNLINEKKKIEE